MNIKYLRSILKFSNKLNRYRLEDPAYIFDPNIDIKQYIVQKGEEMRLDLIMESIYGDISYYEYVDVILYINGIDNPLNINSGQIIYYPSTEVFDDLLLKPDIDVNRNDVALAFSNSSKVSKSDPNRDKYVNNNFSLPPVVNKTPTQPIRVENGFIKMGGLN
jgi:hypothetical protein